MNLDSNSKREWPPTYDFDGLQSQIRDLAVNRRVRQDFYISEFSFDSIYQGDVIQLNAQIPILDEDGDVAVIDSLSNYWVVLGNTCDLTRDLNDVKYSQITPLEPLSPDTPQELLDGLLSCNTYKKFILPNWRAGVGADCMLDFTVICTVEKACLFSNAKVVARMKRLSWILLHCCLVRYFARSDGRHI